MYVYALCPLWWTPKCLIVLVSTIVFGHLLCTYPSAFRIIKSHFLIHLKLTWRGSPTPLSNQFTPKLFQLSLCNIISWYLVFLWYMTMIFQSEHVESVTGRKHPLMESRNQYYCVKRGQFFWPPPRYISILKQIAYKQSQCPNLD